VSRDARRSATPGAGDDPAAAEPFEMLADTVPASVARIRRFTADACRSITPRVDADTVALLVSEVATNALVHGEGRVRVRVRPTSDGLRVEVHDDSPTLPARRRATPMDEGGRGIALVEALSSGWGAERTADGKTVWFEVDAPTG
jgi:anti-sigma regulatory factor (Ser/Thr protein kinase)